jgi:predicted amidophosphoribosyltransferase
MVNHGRDDFGPDGSPADPTADPGVVEAAGRFAYPGACLICTARNGHRPDPLCLDCRLELLDDLGPSCPRCALPVGPFAAGPGGCGECSGRRLGFDRAIALGPYQGPIRHLCLGLKRVQGAWLADRLVDLLLEARGESIRSVEAAAVVPIPLHWRRRLHRRYDQAEALALALARRLELPVARPLRRVRPTEALWRFGRVKRQTLMRGAFRVDPRRLSGLDGKPVLLVDDILTTGATSGAAGRALKLAGVGPVTAVVIGRAEGRG